MSLDVRQDCSMDFKKCILNYKLVLYVPTESIPISVRILKIAIIEFVPHLGFDVVCSAKEYNRWACFSPISDLGVVGRR